MFNKDIGIDLGTANVLIYIKGQGIVLNEPSVVAIDAETKKPLAVGTEAHEMLGRTPGKVKAIKPMKDGVIADYDTTEVMLNYFIKKVNGKSFFSRPRILICCPSNITQVEKNAIKEAAGAGQLPRRAESGVRSRQGADVLRKRAGCDAENGTQRRIPDRQSAHRPGGRAGRKGSPAGKGSRIAGLHAGKTDFAVRNGAAVRSVCGHVRRGRILILFPD